MNFARVILATFFCMVGSAGSAVGEVRAGVRPVPEEVAQVDVRRGLRTKFAKDFADVSVAGKRRLAGMMLREAGMAAGDAAVYVTLQETRELAISAGEVELALQAAGEIGRKFEVDSEAVKFSTMNAVAKGKMSPGQAGVLARAARGVVGVRLGADDFDGAARAAGLAEEAGRKSGEVGLQTELALLEDHCREVLAKAPDFRRAMETIGTQPDNAAANQAAGEFLVFAKQEWGRGLVMLSRGTDAGLKSAAEVELANGRGLELMGAAETWAKVAEGRKGPGREVAARHARGLFERAAGDLSGVEKQTCLEKVAQLIGLLPAGAELADVGAARGKLGEVRWEWVEGLRLGGMGPREDLGTLKNWQAVVAWSPRRDERGDLVELPEVVGEARLASDKTGGLTYVMRVLCVDATGREVVLEKLAKVQMRDGGKELRLQGPAIADIKRLNNARSTPAGAYVQVRLDGVLVAERVWCKPLRSAWWLDEGLVERRGR